MRLKFITFEMYDGSEWIKYGMNCKAFETRQDESYMLVVILPDNHRLFYNPIRNLTCSSD